VDRAQLYIGTPKRAVTRWVVKELDTDQQPTWGAHGYKKNLTLVHLSSSSALVLWSMQDPGLLSFLNIWFVLWGEVISCMPNTEPGGPGHTF
jgi:hypothetical protein